MFGKNQPYRKSCQWVALGCHQISFHVNHSTVMDKTGPVTNQSFRRCSHYRDKWHITATVSTTAQDTNEISWMVHFRCWQREFFAKYPLLKCNSNNNNKLQCTSAIVLIVPAPHASVSLKCNKKGGVTKWLSSWSWSLVFPSSSRTEPAGLVLRGPCFNSPAI